jgi:hypothetical protein
MLPSCLRKTKNKHHRTHYAIYEASQVVNYFKFVKGAIRDSLLLTYFEKIYN